MSSQFLFVASREALTSHPGCKYCYACTTIDTAVQLCFCSPSSPPPPPPPPSPQSAHSSALDTRYNIRVALKKLARPFQTDVHAKRSYRELRYLKHMKHENVSNLVLQRRFRLVGRGVQGCVTVCFPAPTHHCNPDHWSTGCVRTH